MTAVLSPAPPPPLAGVVPPRPAPPGSPPLRWWQHLWRVLACAVIGFTLLAVLVEELPAQYPSWVDGLLLADLVLLGPLAFGLLLLHRRFPLTIAVVITLLTTVSSFAAGAGLLVLVSVSARRRWREIVPLAVLSFACGMVYEAIYPAEGDLPWGFIAPFVGAIVGIAVGWGLYLGARRELVDSWRLRAESAEREQAVAAERAREAERSRIAREMHDVLAHRLSLLSMHAGALAFRDDLPPETVRDEARVIQRTAREALDELRGVLGVLRAPASGALGASDVVEPPQPTLADLDALVAQARVAGPVDLEERQSAVPPAALGRHAYRIVQEALTNARKHAPGAAVRVVVEGGPGAELVVDVRNDPPAGLVPPASGAGLGLVGLAERAALAGGVLTHGPLPDGGFAVTARLPWPAEGA